MEILQLEQIRQLTKTERYDQISQVKAAIFDLKFKRATKKNIKTHHFKSYKKMLAQLLTIETQ